MFLGEYRHTIDEKGRLTIPAKYRGLLAAGMVITRGFDRNLMAFSLEGWEELAARVKSLPWSDPSAREFRRRVFSGAVDLVPDRQGRVLLPPFCGSLPTSTTTSSSPVCWITWKSGIPMPGNLFAMQPKATNSIGKVSAFKKPVTRRQRTGRRG